MEEPSKQSAAIAEEIFDEIAIDPIEDISVELIFNEETNGEIEEKVEWVAAVDAIEETRDKDAEISTSPDSEPDQSSAEAVQEAESPTCKITDAAPEITSAVSSLDHIDSLLQEVSQLRLKKRSAKKEASDPFSGPQYASLDEIPSFSDQSFETEAEKLKDPKSIDSTADQEILAQPIAFLEQEKAGVDQKSIISLASSRRAPSKSKRAFHLDASDDAAIKNTLAEVSFLEGNESLAKNDRFGAIKHYREAFLYAPGNAQFVMKLADLLAEESATRSEAVELLAKGIEETPANLELRAKLAELRKAMKGSTGPLGANSGKSQEVKTELKRDKTGKLKRVKIVAAEALALPNRISLTNQIIIGVLLGIAMWSIAISVRTEPAKINLKLVIPPDETSVSLDKIEFEWKGAADKFLLQIEENGKKVLERTVLETVYRMNPEDRALLKPDRRYTWRVAPCNVQGEPLLYIEDDFHFKTIK